MSLSLERKQQIVEEVAQVSRSAASAVSVDYRGLSAGEMNELRRQARTSGVQLRVVKNTLAGRALQESDFACMSERFQGPLLLAFSEQDPGAAARLVRDFAQDHEHLVIRMASVDNQLIEASAIGKLADLPTREVVIARLMSAMLGPVRTLVQVLRLPQVKLLGTLNAIGEQKRSS